MPTASVWVPLTRGRPVVPKSGSALLATCGRRSWPNVCARETHLYCSSSALELALFVRVGFSLVVLESSLQGLPSQWFVTCRSRDSFGIIGSIVVLGLYS